MKLSKRSWSILAILAISCILLALALNIRELVDLDKDLYLSLRGDDDSGLMIVFESVTVLGSWAVWSLLVVVLWISRKKEPALALLIAVVFVLLIAYSMKYAVDRPRPYDVLSIIEPSYHPSDPSFPSSHAMMAFAGAVAIGSKWRKALPPLLAVALVVSYSRIFIGVHYPYDVISGAVIGILIGLFASSVDIKRIIERLEE